MNKKNIYLPWIIFLLALIVNLFCILKGQAMDNMNRAGKKYAEEINSNFGGIAARSQPQLIPAYKGSDVPETKYYGNNSDFENSTKAESLNNKTATYLREAANKRPNIKMELPTDPLFKRYNDITIQAHALSETYQGCKKLPVGTEEITKYQKKSCFEYGKREEITFKCERKLVLKCKNQDAGEEEAFNLQDFTISGPSLSLKAAGFNIILGEQSNFRSTGCELFTNRVYFNLSNLDEILDFRIENFSYDDWLILSINDKVIYSDASIPYASCERNYLSHRGGIELKHLLKKGMNVLNIKNTVGGGGRVYIVLSAKKKKSCAIVEEMVSNCAGGRSTSLPSGHLISRSCLESGGEKIIHGTQVTRNCWRWSDLYTLLDPPIYTKDPDCAELVKSGCGYISSSCVEEGPTYCKKRLLSYSCSSKEAAKFVEICGNEFICSDNKCTEEYQKYNPATSDLKKAVTAMEVAKELASELNINKLSVFKGVNKECKEHILGFKNCCKAKGWGVNIGITNCSSDEQELGLAREAGKAHFIGAYKVGNTLNRRSYQVYCIYPSKLARIITEQGKKQLGKGFGDPKSPDCSGFTQTELESINFDLIDFSEFYSDAIKMVNTRNTPSIKSYVDKFKSSIEQKLKGLNQGK